MRPGLDVAAINALGQALKGSGRPLLITSGTLAMPTGRVSSETDTPDETAFGGYRIPGERAALALADHGVRSSVIRLAPTVVWTRSRCWPWRTALSRR
jgi:hypothetical protein